MAVSRQRALTWFSLIGGVLLCTLDAQVRPADTPNPQAPTRRIVRTPGRLSPLSRPTSATDSWPSFRGVHASGIADGQQLPDTWDGTTGNNIVWRTRIPGLAHSSPIVWGDRVYLTTAISSRADAAYKPGMYGDGTPSDDRSRQRWLLYAIDKRTGKILWERAANEGAPVETRHIKNTYASATPATDGRIVVAWFGSQGVYAYNLDGTLRWKIDVGHLDIGAYNVSSLEWGSASSPIIWNDLVFLQCDTHADSFVLALNAATGDVVWKSDRVELPSWGTPTIVTTPDGAQLVTNASNFIRGYDARTGKELWRLGRSSQITAPTPIFADGLIVVASGRSPERPIFVVRPSARGDITLPEGATSSESVVWSRTNRGPYMPTPLAYRGQLYVVANNGVFHAYRLATGEQLYETRVPNLVNGISASPVAADGKIYISGEDGDIVVVEAGSAFKHIATNPMGEPMMATPALSGGVMFVRTSSHLFAIDRTPAPLALDPAPPPSNVMRGESRGPLLTMVIVTSGGAEHAAVTGTWDGEVQGVISPMLVTLKVEGNRVSGTLVYNDIVQIEEGTVAGNQISFKVKSPNGLRTVTLTGIVKDDRIEFVRTLHIPEGAPPGGAGIFGVGGPPGFVLSRQKRE